MYYITNYYKEEIVHETRKNEIQLAIHQWSIKKTKKIVLLNIIYDSY